MAQHPAILNVSNIVLGEKSARVASFLTWTILTTGSSTLQATLTSWTLPPLYPSSSSLFSLTSTWVMAALLSDQTLTRTQGTRMTRRISTNTLCKWKEKLGTSLSLPELCSTAPCQTQAKDSVLASFSTWLLFISSKFFMLIFCGYLTCVSLDLLRPCWITLLMMSRLEHHP